MRAETTASFTRGRFGDELLDGVILRELAMSSLRCTLGQMRPKRIQPGLALFQDSQGGADYFAGRTVAPT